jgi:hypothetical protein
MVIRRVAPLSVAKIAGALYMVLGLIFGALFSLIAIAGSMASVANDSGPGAVFGALFGVGAVVFFPIFYGVMAFVMAFISALLYNALAGTVGGVEIEVQ